MQQKVVSETCTVPLWPTTTQGSVTAAPRLTVTSSGWAENDCEDNTLVTMVMMIVMVIIVQWTVSGPTTLTLNTAS